MGVAGCTREGTSGTATSSPAGRVSSTQSSDIVGISPAGVTTSVDAPADSTEEEYFQACHAARLWMDAQPKTGESLLEPYLAMVQTSQVGAAGTWNIRWADLTPPRQAAVIVAARAAVNAECG
nr:lipoprotein LpqV [Mycobacterium spongiae]